MLPAAFCCAEVEISAHDVGGQVDGEKGPQDERRPVADQAVEHRLAAREQRRDDQKVERRDQAGEDARAPHRVKGLLEPDVKADSMNARTGAAAR